MSLALNNVENGKYEKDLAAFLGNKEKSSGSKV